MSRSRRAVRPLYLFIMFMLFAPLLSAQEADSTDGILTVNAGDVPFSVNAGRYRLRVYPELCLGFGVHVAAPDLSEFDSRYQEGSRPSQYSPLGSLSLNVRLQPVSWLGIAVSTEGMVDLSLRFDADERYDRWIRNAITVTGHHTMHPAGLLSVFAGAGITRIDYEHSGYPWAADQVLHITAREVGGHVTGGIELDMVGGPILSLSAAYDFMPTVEEVDLSSFVAGFHFLFQM